MNGAPDAGMTLLTLVVLGLGVGLLLLWTKVSRLSATIDDLESRQKHQDVWPVTSAMPPEATPAPPPVAKVATPPPPRVSAPVIDTPPAARPEETQPEAAAGWEMAVGASWANKVGAAVTVIGLALALGYSMTTLGPAGRIAVGLTSSLGLLALGTLFERRPAFRLFSYGLTAAGWAGTYFTTYAMRNVPAAQVISSDIAGSLLLVVVAVAMIAHGLRYRSRTVTALTYLIAFTTLGLSPLTTFSLAASLPLAASLLVVSERQGWTDLSALGVAASYAIFVLRSQAGPLVALDPSAWPSWAMLALLWLTFEAADLLSRRRPTGRRHASLFALNAVGFVTSGLLHAPDTALAASAFSAAAAGGFLASAIARARLFPAEAPAAGTPGTMFAGWSTMHTALALSVALSALTIELRFDGLRQIAAYLLVTELVFVAGLTLGDRLIRHMGAALAVFTTFQLTAASGRATGVFALGPARIELWSVFALILAGAWYAQRGWLRHRAVIVEPLEHAYSWTATLLVGLTIGRELQAVNATVAGLAFAAVLIEIGLRRSAEYRYQAYLVAANAACWLAAIAAADLVPFGPTQEWIALPAAAAISYWMAWRLVRRRTSEASEPVVAAVLAASFGTLFVVLFEHQVLPEAMLGPAFASTALALVLADRMRHAAILRWHALLLLVAGMVRAVQPIFEADPLTGAETGGVMFAVAAAYACTLLTRNAARRDPAAPAWVADVEDVLRPAVSLLATAALAFLIVEEAPDGVRTLLWAVQGVLLLAAGIPFRERVLRRSGLAVLGLAVGRLFLHDFSQQEALARIVSFVSLGVFLLGVSWVYTRYRDRIQKYL